MVIAFTIIIAQKGHGVIVRDVLWMLLYEALDTIPKCWNRLHILVQTQDKAVLLLIVFHEPEGVVVDIAKKLYTWLHTPVVLELVHQRMSEEKARLKSTHVPVADGVAIDDLALRHVFTDLARLVLVDEGGERPVLLGDLSIVSLSRNERCCDLLEGFVKSFVI